MLQNWLLPQMSEDSEDFIFQQDGVPPHWHRDGRRFLNEFLPQRWIGRVGKKTWRFSSGPRDLLISHPATFSCGGVRKRSSLCTVSTNNFGRPKKPYHNCDGLSDARHSSSGVERIQLPSRCYPCGRREAH